METLASREMPKYKCHKQVWALKIKAIELKKPTISELEDMLRENEAAEPIGAIITPEEDGYAPFAISQDFMRKHDPVVGGYYVVYADGYKSFSPAQAFEEGYTRI